MPRSRLARAGLIALGIMVVATAGLALALRLLLDPAKLKATLETQASAALGERVSIASARAELYPRIGLRLGGVEIGVHGTTIERLDVSTGLGPLLKRRVEDADLRVRGARIDPSRLERRSAVPYPNDGAEASTDVGVGGLRVVSIREITIEELEIRGRNHHSIRVDLRAAVAGERLDVREITLTTGRSRMTGHATLDNSSELVGSFALDGSMLDLDQLSETLAGLAPPAPGGDAERPAPVSTSHLAGKLTGKLTAEAARLSGLELRDLQADVVVTGARVSLDPLTAALYDGTYAGALTLDFSGNAPRVSFRGRLERVDVASLAKAMGSTAGASGRLTATLDVRGAGADMTQALRSARGRGDLALDHGALKGLDIAHKALTYLGVANTAIGGDSFTQLTSRIVLSDGRLRTDDLVMLSPDFDLRGKGSVDVDGRLQMTARMLLSPALSAIAERNVKELAYAKDGDRITLPLVISGTVAYPSVTIDTKALAKQTAGKTVEKAQQGLLRRLFGK